MNGIYLSSKVGLPLTECLGELVEKIPKDPIEWIAHWLYRYIDKEIYFFEKSIFLKDLHRMRLELAREKALRHKTLKSINAEIADIKHMTKEDVGMFANLMRLRMSSEGIRRVDVMDDEMLKQLGKSMGISPSKMSPEEYAQKLESLRRHKMYSTDGKKSSKFSNSNGEDSSRWIQRSIDSRGSRVSRDVFGRKKRAKDSATTDSNDLALKPGTCAWCLDCNFGLVAVHSVLGELRARCPLACPETPDVWEDREYLLESLYDHEIYTTDFGGDLNDDQDDDVEGNDEEEQEHESGVE